jgi:hypothetical protein
MKLVSLLVCLGLPFGASCGDDVAPTVPETIAGHCNYTNRFSGLDECREMRGDGWTPDTASAFCTKKNVPLEPGPCVQQPTLGTCILEDDPALFIQVIMAQTDVSLCGSTDRGCAIFAGGTWLPGPVCGGATLEDFDNAYSEKYYEPESYECRMPTDGVPGTGEDGQVCFWQQMSGCVEEGRNYADYASCEDVRTQRPYGASPANTTEPAVDVRMDDPAYRDELAWVTKQVESCACVCCHQTSKTPSGAGVWDTEFAGSNNWVSSFTTWGLAFSANAFDTSLQGSYPPAENNGFGRSVSGMPSTDEPRMKRFFENELVHRGSSAAAFEDRPPFPAAFYQQDLFEPSACVAGEGIDAEGVMRWRGGRARYVYVLDVGSRNPGAPPSLDSPEGMLWRVDTVPPAVPMKTGEVQYGVVPEGARARVDVAPALQSGQQYYLYVQADVLAPVTRCLFTAP